MRAALLSMYMMILTAGCDGSLGAAQDIVEVGLQEIGSASGVPQSGEGVAPLIGAGGDGAWVTMGTGVSVAGSTGPGAIRGHGGQWVIPYGTPPGSVIANMWCDVIPRADATDLVELVGPAGVIGTVQVPATSLNIVIRAWIVPTAPGYVVPDGGPVVVRHNMRDAVTGSWTSAAQDMTIIGCAVNTRRGAQAMISPTLFSSTTGEWHVSSSPHTMFTRSTSGSDLVGGLQVHAGDTLSSVTMPVSGIGHLTVTAKLLSQSMGTQLIGIASLDATDPSIWQPLTLNLQNAIVASGVGLDLAITGIATTTWGVDVGVIALSYTPAM